MNKNDYISSSHPEWGRMWAALGAIEGDTACLCPKTGEVWQYMGSMRSYKGVDRWVHTFRHRCHPSNGQRRYHAIPASVEYERQANDLNAQRVQSNKVVFQANAEAQQHSRDVSGVLTNSGDVVSDADPGL